jgi:hypothetical protein
MGNHGNWDIAALRSAVSSIAAIRRGEPRLYGGSYGDYLFYIFFILLFFHTSCGKQELTNVFISEECCPVSTYQDQWDAVRIAGAARGEILLLSHAMGFEEHGD